MKMKLSWLLLVTVVIVSSIAIVSCKKTIDNLTNNVDNTNSSSAKTQSSDGSLVNVETSQADNDVNNTTAASARMNPNRNGATGTANGIPSNADTSYSVAYKTLTINYHGVIPGTCRSRTGSITIQLTSGNNWVDSGSVLLYTFNNYTVTNSCNGKTIILNGTRTIKNLSGGSLYTIFKSISGYPSTVKFRFRANYNVSFIDSGSTVQKNAVWNEAFVTSTIYVTGAGYAFSSAGDSTYNGTAFTESWGTTRNGDNFTTVFAINGNSTPVTSNTFCSYWGIRPTGGSVVYTVAGIPYSVIYGLDVTGNVSTSSTCGILYYRVTWPTIGTATASALIPY